VAEHDIKAAQAELNATVLGRDGVSGTAIGLHGGSPCLKVYVRDAKAARGLPKRVRGFRVVTEATGDFRRL
jgi:hypothetical protein